MFWIRIFRQLQGKFWLFTQGVEFYKNNPYRILIVSVAEPKLFFFGSGSRSQNNFGSIGSGSATLLIVLKLDFYLSIGAIFISGCKLAVSMLPLLCSTVFFQSHKKGFYFEVTISNSCFLSFYTIVTLLYGKIFWLCGGYGSESRIWKKHFTDEDI